MEHTSFLNIICLGRIFLVHSFHFLYTDSYYITRSVSHVPSLYFIRTSELQINPEFAGVFLFVIIYCYDIFQKK